MASGPSAERPRGVRALFFTLNRGEQGGDATGDEGTSVAASGMNSQVHNFGHVEFQPVIASFPNVARTTASWSCSLLSSFPPE